MNRFVSLRFSFESLLKSPYQRRCLDNGFESSRHLQAISHRFSRSLSANANTPNADVASTDDGLNCSDTFGTLDETFYEKNVRPVIKKLNRVDRKRNATDTSTKEYRDKESKTNFKGRDSKKSSMDTSKPHDWDVFGTLASSSPDLGDKPHNFYDMPSETGVVEVDPQDKLETNLPNPERRMHPQLYATMMKGLIKGHKLKEALEVLYVRMKEDRIPPNKRVYNVLIDGCAKVGYTEMAFQLFRQLLQRGLTPSGSTYTGLFNCCSNAPTMEDGLRNARYLKEKMLEKGHVTDQITYHAMIKAFGRCGDTKTAFSIADTMMQEEHTLTTETLSFLLMACAQDKEAGFRFAIEVWRKFLYKRVPVNAYSYNLLLRVVRDCGIGRPEQADQLLTSERPEQPPLLPGPKNPGIPDNVLALSEGNEETCHPKVSLVCSPEKAVDRSVVQAEDTRLPDLLSPVLFPGPVIGFTPLLTSDARLSALGGPLGILSRMKRDKLKPDIKTMTLLLQSLIPDTQAEEELLKFMDEYRVKPDVDFFNLVIKRRCFRDDFEGAKDVLSILQKRYLEPDIITFGVLAIGCNYLKDGKTLLEEIQSAGFRPNIEILGALMKNAVFRLDWRYAVYLLKVAEAEEIMPSKLMLDHIEDKLRYAKRMTIKEERGQEVPPHFKKENYKESFKIFQIYYKRWLGKMKLDQYRDPWHGLRPNKKLEEETVDEPAESEEDDDVEKKIGMPKQNQKRR